MNQQRENSVEASALCFGYTSALTAPFSASFKKGRLIALTGGNGSGKSTLLRTLLGLLPPVSGQIKLNGDTTDHFSFRDRSKHMSAVLTDRSGVDGLTVKSLVDMGRQPYLSGMGSLSEHDEAEVVKALDLMSIADFRNRLIGELSDGEKQRAFIARALAQDTAMIIMDEPLAFLDFPGKRQTLQMLRKLVDETHKTVLFSTHELPMIPDIADEVLIISNRRVDHVGGSATDIKSALQNEFGDW